MTSSLDNFLAVWISFLKLFGESRVVEFTVLSIISFIVNFCHFDVSFSRVLDFALMDVSWKLENRNKKLIVIFNTLVNSVQFKAGKVIK